MNTPRPETLVSDVQAPVTRPWWQLGLAAAVIAVVANLIVFAIAVGAASIDVRITPGPGESELVDLTAGPVILMSVVPALLATLLAAGLAKWTAAPRRWFLGVAAVILVLSLFPVAGLAISTGAKVTLALMHLITAAAIVGLLAPPLAAVELAKRR